MFVWVNEPDGLTFEGELEIGSVENLQSVLVENLKTKKKLRLDLRKVSRLDTAASQVLLALTQSEGPENLKLLLSNEVSQTFDHLGFMPHFQAYLSEESDL